MTLPTILPMADVKARLSEYVSAVQATHERIVLTRNGRPVALLIGIDDYTAMQETIEVLADAEQMRRLREADEEAARGEYLTEDQVGQLLAERIERNRRQS